MITKTLADFTASLSYDKLTPVSVDMTKKCILDWLGVSIRGSREQPAKLIRQTILCNEAKQATIFDGGQSKASVFDAAFCNGAASHTLDFDDLHNPSIIHLATVVVPGVFAIAEAEHKSGRQMIAAVCAGYEAGGRIGESVIPESYFFWHTTGTAGTFGAAAAAANLLQLTPQQTLMCYGSAGTQAAGLWEFLKEGAMSKALHAGKSSYAGVLAAYLSRNGFTAASSILEGEKGFCRAMVAEPHWDRLTEGLDSRHLRIDENSLKPYACCKHSHAAIYAAQVLKKEHELQPENISEVRIYVNDITDYLINNPQPQNPYGCKFSIQYCVAAMLTLGAVGIEQFAQNVIHNTEVRDLMSRTKVIRDAAIEKIHQEDASKLASRLEVVCKDGTVHSMKIDYPKGDPDNPVTWEEAKAKFMHLAVPVYGQQQAGKLCSLIENLEECEDLAQGLAQCWKEG